MMCSGRGKKEGVSEGGGEGKWRREGRSRGGREGSGGGKGGRRERMGDEVRRGSGGRGVKEYEIAVRGNTLNCLEDSSP